MFIRSKEEVAKKLNNLVRNYHYPSNKYTQFNNENEIGSSIRERVREAMADEINKAIRQFGAELVNAIVNELYDNNDFEKDIGLR